MSKFIFLKSELIFLLNALIDKGIDSDLNIALPLLNGLRIFNLQIDAKKPLLSHLITQDEYDDMLEKKLGKVSRWDVRSQFPKYKDIISALYQSGILLPSGRDSLEDTIRWAKSRPVTKGGDIFYLAFDTSTVRDRFFSNYLREYIDSTNVDFILTETVREELANRDDKIQKGLLRDLKQVIGNQADFCFRNQNQLEDRQRYVGYSEYNLIRSLTGCDQLPDAHAHSHRSMDEEIIDAYSQFAAMGRKVVLISRDNEMIRMSTGLNNVIPILIEQDPFPRMNSEIQVSWESLLSFFSLLGILGGSLELKISDKKLAEIHGVWSYKDALEWEKEMVMVQMNKRWDFGKERSGEYFYIENTLSGYQNILESMRR